MLPASKTEAERVAQAKADLYDPRDNHSYYKFTGASGDVLEVPAESEPVQALLIGWPGGASGLTSYFAKLIKYGSAAVDTTVVYTNQSAYSGLYYQLQSAGVDLDRISFVGMDLDTIWMRDYGPLLARTTSGYRVIDFRYYYGRWDDDVAPTRLAKAWGVPVSRPPLEAEGGNFQSDGAGRCITTDMMVYQNQGRGYSSQDVKSILKKYLGCKTTIILPSLAGEGTGHVDMLATITGPGEVIVGQYPKNEDPTNAKRLDTAASMLKSAGFKVRRVTQPTNWDNNFRSYTNSLAIGNRVLLPVYSDDSRFDSQAIAVFKQAYPGRTIIPIDSTQIISWAGAIHCVTMTLGI
jgi:agmatine/peptidylarginine deiminase